MKIILLLLIFFCTSCSTLNSSLKHAVAYGKIKDINTLSPNVDKQLYLRLYQSPIFEKECFKETRGVCKYNYFLSVSTFDEHPMINIFQLSYTGEISAIKWKPSTDIDAAKIEILASKYTKEALNNNNSLVDEKLIISLVITPHEIIELVSSP